MLNAISRDFSSPNHDARDHTIDTIVLHYTGMQNAGIALRRLCDPAPLAKDYPGPWQGDDIVPETPLGRVSAHYVVAETGEIFSLVPEEHRAWHAGRSFWAGAENLNARSIGIEIVNGGHDFGLPPYPAAQIDALIALLHDIVARRAVAPGRLLGHSDIAPGRKADPGEHFPWRKLAEAGLGLWPGPVTFDAAGRTWIPGDEGPDIAALQAALATLGWVTGRSGHMDSLTCAAIEAFQRRFRPRRVDGTADPETRALIEAMLERMKA